MLRHSCGFYLANRGYDLRLIQDYLGHRDRKPFRRSLAMIPADFASVGQFGGW
jgi:integrase